MDLRVGILVAVAATMPSDAAAQSGARHAPRIAAQETAQQPPSDTAEKSDKPVTPPATAAAPAPAPSPAQPPAPSPQPAPAPTPPQGPAQAQPPSRHALPPVEIIQTKRQNKHLVKRKQKTSGDGRRVAGRAAPRRTSVQVIRTFDTAGGEAPAEGAPANEATEATVKMSPVAGSEVPVWKVPGSVDKVNAEEISRDPSPVITDVMRQRIPGVILNDVQGNEFQTNLQFRGFEASPVNGTPQGLAVYQNGVRINEVFGDTVNWDLIPTTAISDITLVSNNPVFGLNALGGAVSVTMKDGFNYHGTEADVRAGSYGRIQGTAQTGAQEGNLAGYAALEGVNDSGWRRYSPSQVRRMYADVGVMDGEAELHFTFTGADNRFGVVGPTPTQMLAQNYASVFTSPQTTHNQLAMTSISGTAPVTDTLKLSGVGYFRGFRQKHTDGNFSDVQPCADDASILCLGEHGDPLTTLNGQVPSSIFDGWSIGSLDRTGVRADGLGGSVQAVEKSRLFDHGNQFLIGASVDHGDVRSTAASELGSVDPSTLIVLGFGLFPTGPEGIAPVALNTTTTYYGAYVTDTFDVTSDFAVTAGGRYNDARIAMRDQLGVDLNGDHTYQRFNPMVGATFKLAHFASLYGGYSEANRAPTPAELSCADPERPCLLEGFLVADPELKQIVSHTAEIGLRGGGTPWFAPGKLNWSAGLFQTENTDDIIAVASPIQQGRGYFRNAGETLRQGVQASLTYKGQGFSAYANYAYVDATFQTPLELSSPYNPFAMPCVGAEPDDAPACIFVRPGDSIPSVPPHQFKTGFDVWLTDAWKFGADAVAVSGQHLMGDESNWNPKLPAYAFVNLHTSYDVDKNVQLYGYVNNVFDSKFYTFGTFYETQPDLGLTNPRMYTPGQPLAVYGGIKLKF